MYRLVQQPPVLDVRCWNETYNVWTLLSVLTLLILLCSERMPAATTHDMANLGTVNKGVITS